MCSVAQLLALITAGCFILSAPAPIGAYNILGIFPTMSRSHLITGGALMRGLAEAGHNVTVISPFPLAKPVPNYRDIAVLGISEHMKDTMPDLLAMNDRNPLLIQWDVLDMGFVITNYTLSHPVMRKFLADPTEKFDVIICEVFINEAMLGLGPHFNAPVIGYSTFGASMWSNDMVGTPSPMSYVPHTFLSFTDRMTYAQRVGNVLMTAYEAFAFRWHLASQTALYEEAFAGTAKKPSLAELRRNVSLVLLNTHHTLGTPRPYVPNMIEIGGVHINREAARPLPDQMRAFVEGATHGCIYFSMGSNIRSSDLPPAVRDGILSALGQLKQRVLWKWEEADLPGRPENVLISPWFPQQDVLAHPNVRLFITHGGLLSTTEAVYHGVPLIGIPVFGDQALNMGRAEAAGFARTVLFSNLTEASLVWAVQEVLGVESYARQATLVSQRYRDQPMTPMETGVFWVEYVVRHRGAPHLHCAGQDLNVWVYHSVDVYATLFAVLLLLVWAVCWTVRWTVRRLFLGGKRPIVKDSKKKSR